ncbi:MAG TPA: hypothetical protein VGO96_20810 [Pyrinomonadaceae bacterium]|jgi:hypothetical protein|nr:hypothetical protein [Pyrinomonadaceae bacterium]
MKDSDTRRYEAFLRVREFGTSHAAQFPPNSFGAEKFSALGEVIKGLDEHATTQVSGRSTARQGVTGKAAARDELRRDLEAITRTARSMAFDTPGLDDKFRLPREPKDQELLSAARAFAVAAQPLAAEFTRRGLPANFLADLASDIESFEQAISRKTVGRAAHVAATAAIDDLIEDGMKHLRQLDTVVRNIFADDPATLAGWTSASHVERAPRTKQPLPPPAEKQV